MAQMWFRGCDEHISAGSGYSRAKLSCKQENIHRKCFQQQAVKKKKSMQVNEGKNKNKKSMKLMHLAHQIIIKKAYISNH